MNFKKIIREEVNDFDWVDDIEPIPESLHTITNLPLGRYKLWLGEVSKEQQLATLNLIKYKIEADPNVVTNESLRKIIYGTTNDDIYNITSLFFDVRITAGENMISVSMMPLSRGLDYCRNYFNNSFNLEI